MHKEIHQLLLLKFRSKLALFSLMMSERLFHSHKTCHALILIVIISVKLKYALEYMHVVSLIMVDNIGER